MLAVKNTAAYYVVAAYNKLLDDNPPYIILFK